MGRKLSAPNNTGGECGKQKLSEIQRESHEKTVSAGDFNLSLSKSIDLIEENRCIEELLI